MKVVLQRVKEAKVEVDHHCIARIDKGVLLLVGVAEADTQQDVDWLVHKIVNVRIFEDEAGKMNYSIRQQGGDILAVSQFTLLASVKKGNRPSFTLAALPEKAQPLFDQFVVSLSLALEKTVFTGQFGADMAVALINDGPVTLILDSALKA